MTPISSSGKRVARAMSATKLTVLNAIPIMAMAVVVLSFLLATSISPSGGMAYAVEEIAQADPSSQEGTVVKATTVDAMTASSATNNIFTAKADAISATDYASAGFVYRVSDIDKMTVAVVGFEDSESLGESAIVPCKIETADGEFAVDAVKFDEGQIMTDTLSLTLDDSVTYIDTASVASALPMLASITIDGIGGLYSSYAGVLYQSHIVLSDGVYSNSRYTTLLWVPPAAKSINIPLGCAEIADGAFTDAPDLAVVYVHGPIKFIADGAMTQSQAGSLSVVPVRADSLSATSGNRVSQTVALSNVSDESAVKASWITVGLDDSQISESAGTAKLIALSEAKDALDYKTCRSTCDDGNLSIDTLIGEDSREGSPSCETPIYALGARSTQTLADTPPTGPAADVVLVTSFVSFGGASGLTKDNVGGKYRAIGPECYIQVHNTSQYKVFAPYMFFSLSPKAGGYMPDLPSDRETTQETWSQLSFASQTSWFSNSGMPGKLIGWVEASDCLYNIVFPVPTPQNVNSILMPFSKYFYYTSNSTPDKHGLALEPGETKDVFIKLLPEELPRSLFGARWYLGSFGFDFFYAS